MIHVPKPLFAQLIKGMSCSEIVEKGRARTSFRVEGRKVVITGGISTYERGWYRLFAQEFQYLEEYKGDLIPLEQSAHYDAIYNGLIPRGYAGMKIKLDGRWIVFVGESLNIEASEEGQQLKLF